jgi:hypothetical protein
MLAQVVPPQPAPQSAPPESAPAFKITPSPGPHPTVPTLAASTSVVKVSPGFGAIGTSVVITGDDAAGGLSDATAVYFGGVPATFTANNDRTLTALAPSPPPIGISVSVTVLLGGVLLPSSAAFTYQVGQLMVSGPLAYDPSQGGGAWDYVWQNKAKYGAYSLSLDLPNNGSNPTLVFPNFSPTLHLGTLFHDTETYNYGPPALCPWSAPGGHTCLSAGNEGQYSVEVQVCTVSPQSGQGSPNCTDWANNTGWWLPVLICASASQPCTASATVSLTSSGAGKDTVGDLAVPLGSQFNSTTLAHTFKLTAKIVQGSTVNVPGFGALDRQASIDSPPFNLVITPTAMVQTSVIPYTLVYAPPGNQSTVSFTASSQYSSQYSVEDDQETDNQYSVEQSSNTAFSLKAAAFFLTGSVDVTTGWDKTVSQNFGQVSGAGAQEQNTLQISNTWTIPANNYLVPGSGAVCASQTDCTSTTTVPNPYALEPFWGDTFVLLVHPEFAAYVMGNSQTRYALYGAVPVTVDALVQQLDYCARGQLLPGSSADQCTFPYSYTGITDVKPGQGPVYKGEADSVTLSATDAAKLLLLDPFYVGGQGANLDPSRALIIPSVPPSGYGAQFKEPARPFGTTVNNTQAQTASGKAQQTSSSTVTGVQSQNDSYGAGIQASGTSPGTAGSDGKGGAPASYGEQLTYTVGSKDTSSTTLKYTFSDSTAVSKQYATQAVVQLNDMDNTTNGSMCKDCHNPLPSQPTAIIYLDRLFGSFMFQDPRAPDPPTLRPSGPNDYSALNLLTLLTGQEMQLNRFSDVSTTDPSRGMIGFVAREGILPGTGKGLFAPNASITRGQLATALASTLQLNTPTGAASAFSDVPAGTALAASIGAAVQAGVMSPASGTAFKPDDSVSRQEMANTLSHGFGLASTQALAVSDAAQIDPGAVVSVAAVVTKGYLKAFPDNTFRPTAAVTREEGAQAIYMALYDRTKAAAQSAQTSSILSNQQHVDFIGPDNHVHELVYTDHWAYADLTTAAGAPNAAPGSPLDGYETSFSNQQHVNFIGADNHVHELVYTDHWAHADLTAAAGAPNAAPGSPLDGYETSFNNQQHVNFIGADNHVHELVYTDHWAHADLTAATGAPNAAPGSPLDGYETSFSNQQHVNFIGADNHVHELVYTDHWAYADLTAAAGAPNAAPGSPLNGYETSFNNQQHVNFIGADNHVHELVYTDHWAHADLTAATGAPNAAPGSPLDGYETSFNNQQHVNFIGTDNHVQELVYTDHWARADLTQASGAPNAAPGSPLDGYETSFNNQQHVNFIGADNHVHELVYTDHWASADLTQAAGAPNAATRSRLDGYQTSSNK